MRGVKVGVRPEWGVQVKGTEMVGKVYTIADGQVVIIVPPGESITFARIGTGDTIEPQEIDNG